MHAHTLVEREKELVYLYISFRHVVVLLMSFVKENDVRINVFMQRVFNLLFSVYFILQVPCGYRLMSPATLNNRDEKSTVLL